MHPTTTSSLHNVHARPIGRPDAEDPNEHDTGVAADNGMRADSRRHAGFSRSTVGRLMMVLALALYLAGVAVLFGQLSLHWQAWMTSLCRVLGYR